jgi:DNA-binding transcriptional LysR family regulator
MDRFLCIQAFVRVAQTRSFSKAAHQLGVTPSVITHRVQQLENFAQAPLLHRSTRTVTLSEAGTALFDECVGLICRADSITDRMRLMQGTPIGTLRLQVLTGFALGHLGRVLKDFSLAYPHIDLDLVVNDDQINPIDRGFDVSLQLFRPSSEVLIERSLFLVRRIFCAAPGYLKLNKAPRVPTDLLKHSLGSYSAYPTRNRWTFTSDGKVTSLELPAKIRTNSVHLLRDFALSGGGITCLPTLVCSDDLLAGRLVPLLQGYEISSFKLLAFYPVSHRAAIKVRLFIDFITKRFSGEPEWDDALRKGGILCERARGVRRTLICPPQLGENPLSPG